MRKKPFPERVVRHWNRLMERGVDALLLSVYKRHWDNVTVL